jgi:hypothetical protein
MVRDWAAHLTPGAAGRGTNERRVSSLDSVHYEEQLSHGSRRGFPQCFFSVVENRLPSALTYRVRVQPHRGRERYACDGQTSSQG